MVSQLELRSKLNAQIVKTQKLIKQAQKILDESYKIQKQIQSFHPPSYHLSKLTKFNKSKQSLQAKMKKEKDPHKKENLTKAHKHLTRDMALTMHDYMRSKKFLPPDTRYHQAIKSKK